MHCAERAQRQIRAPLATLYYCAEQGTNGHILPSVHGFIITPYRLSSLAAADVPHGRQTSSDLSARQSHDQARGMLRSPDRSGHVTHHGASIDQR